MAEIVLKIPEEFEQDFNTDRFKDCFKRVLADCKAWDYSGISGAYEHETIEMFIDAFNEAVVLPRGHGRITDMDEAIKCIEEVIDSKEKQYALYLIDWACSKRVLIESDKEEKNESIS